ncbi:hypothetical protein [Schaalia sp. lx-260]|uniref:hypothetical protein n=1 Tax=Schaalia sp. lx-260 TaxID=2899082 RepID=UPI001E599346|nr:hypothetical protein [Schaalia sp. lx-260]MCD4549687.1 hypothetical protein [Schaalia sp. lx-260]
MSSRLRTAWPNDSQEPRIRIAPAKAAKNYADLACELAASYGLVPDPWQELVLSDWMMADAHNRWKVLKHGLSVPRQNGKNALLEIRELFGMVGLGEHILHSAHEVKTAQAHFRRFKHFFGDGANDPNAKYPELNALVEYVRNVNGQEEIKLKPDKHRGIPGGALRVVARSKSSARGFTADVLVFDEAQELTEDALEAQTPTTSAGPLHNSQWFIVGTPPGPNASGEIFERHRNAALADHPAHNLTWHEWSPDPTQQLDTSDRALWAACNPALEAGRLQITLIEGEHTSLSPEGFARERLGAWPTHAGATRAISPQLWDETTSPAPTNGIRSFAVAFSADGKRQALAGAVKEGSGLNARIHVNIIDTFTGSSEQSIQRVADWLAERQRRTAQINLLGGSGGPALAEALHERGVPRKIVHVMTTSEYFEACSTTFESLRAGKITHPQGTPDDALNSSVAVCDRQVRRKDGAYGWKATTKDGDETPLEAVSAAVYAAKKTRRHPGRKAKALT